MADATNLKVDDSSIFRHRYCTCVRSDPKIRVTVFKQINDPVAVQTRRVVLIENGETVSIKMHQNGRADVCSSDLHLCPFRSKDSCDCLQTDKRSGRCSNPACCFD